MNKVKYALFFLFFHFFAQRRNSDATPHRDEQQRRARTRTTVAPGAERCHSNDVDRRAQGLSGAGERAEQGRVLVQSGMLLTVSRLLAPAYRHAVERAHQKSAKQVCEGERQSLAEGRQSILMS